MAEMLHEPHKTCKRNSLTQDCLICWRLVRSPGAAVGCRARFHPLSPSTQTEAWGCTPKPQPAFLFVGRVSQSPVLQGQGAMTWWEGCFSAHRHGVHNGTLVPLCTLWLRRTLPHSRGHRDLVCLVGNSNGTLFQVFSAPRGFQPTGITGLGFTSSTHCRAGMQTSPWGVLWHTKRSNAKRHSPALIHCTGTLQVHWVLWVLLETSNIFYTSPSYFI